jgi:hypothetical protein
MPERRPARIARVVLLALSFGAIEPAHLHAQQAGHGTVPSTGAAAAGGFPTAERETDPVVAQIEELRRALAELAKQYKKTSTDKRRERKAELLAGLGRMEAEVSALRETLNRKTD